MYSKRAGVRLLNLPSCMPCGLLICRHMQFDVNIRLYEYWHEQVIIRKKRWNNKEIQRNFIENKFVNRKLEKGGWSVPRAPVHPTIKIKAFVTYLKCLILKRNIFWGSLKSLKIIRNSTII
jgi:hypothetical protein